MTTSHLKQLSSPQTHVRFVFSLRLVESEFGGQALALVLVVCLFVLVSLSNSKEKLNHLEVLIIPPGDSNLIHKSRVAVKKKKKTTNIFSFFESKEAL